MDKEFVPYELSLELKELGFDEPCFSIYKTNGELIYTEFYEYNKLQNYNEKSYIGSDWLSLKCYAPLYQQAFRWFREKYGLCGEIYTPDYEDSKWNPQIHRVYEFGNLYDNEGFSSYEESELECIKKLIEIVKRNNNG